MKEKGFLLFSILFIAVFIFSQIYIAINSSPVVWDESVYIGIGKFIYSDGQIGLYESFRPSLLPLLVGAGWKLGLDSILLARLLLASISTTILILTYFISKVYMNRKFAFISSVVLALFPLFFEYSTQILTGMLSVCFVLAGLLAYLYDYNKTAMAMLGLATLSRFPAGMFGVMMIFFIYRKNKKLKETFYSGLIFTLMLAPFFILNLYFGYGIIRPILDALIHQSNNVFRHNPFFYLNFMMKQSIMLIFVIPGIYFAMKDKRHELLAFALLPLIYFSFIINKQSRFILLFLPFIMMLSVYGFYGMLKNNKKHSLNSLALLLFLILSLTLSAQDLSSIQLFGSSEEYTQFPILPGQTIMTTDPIFSAYFDNLFIPLYFDVGKAYNTYHFNYNRTDLLIYSDVYPCNYYQKPQICNKIKNELIEDFEENAVVYNTSRYTLHKLS